MVLDGGDHLVERELDEPPAIPAGDQGEAVVLENRHELGGAARQLVAELDRGIASLSGLGEACLERRLAAELRQIVVAPGDRVDADAHGHGGALYIMSATM